MAESNRVAVRYGFGRHIWTISPQDGLNFAKVSFQPFTGTRHRYHPINIADSNRLAAVSGLSNKLRLLLPGPLRHSHVHFTPLSTSLRHPKVPDHR